eukprot:Skav223566  [mRNA]  locus=scaffold34:257854:258369:+ [translate_table: standard]
MRKKSLPRNLFVGKFQLTEATFAQGLADGDFVEIQEPSGRVVYSWASAEESTTNQFKQSNAFSTGKSLSKKEAMVEQAAFSTWSMPLFKKISSNKALPAPPGSRPMAALEDVEEGMTETEWNAAQEQLNAAMAAYERLLKTAKKHMQTINYEKEDPIYDNLLLVCINKDVF